MSNEVDKIADAGVNIRGELDELRAQVEQARAVLVQLHDAATAVEMRSSQRAAELVAANEQLVVAALRSETRFRAYFDVSPEYLYLLRLTADDRLIFEDVNPAGADLYGLSRMQIVGRAAVDIDSEEGAASINSNGRLALRSGKTVTYEVSRAVGSRPRCSINTIVAPVEKHEGGGLVLVCGRDLTEQRHAEEALRQSQKMDAIGQLTGGIAHDFNNLLTAVMGSLELMQGRIAQGRAGEIGRYVAAAQGASKRAAALTHRLLAFSRRQTLSPTLTDVNRLIRGMEDLIRRTIGPQIELDVAATANLWMTQVDQNQLENALLNLCINARDAMPDGGRLTVEAGNFRVDERMAREGDMLPGQYVSLSVSDTGSGMTPEVISRAFDPFFTTKPIGSGTGLGLSMIYGFAKQSGGQVRIYSEIGRGAMVCIYFPRFMSGDEPMPVGTELVTAPRATPGETVLVVDDEEVVRMLVIEVLEDLGYTSLEAVDGASGLKILRSSARIDLLVTDVGLPGGMNGRQLADAARALRAELKILFITGYAENAVINHGHLEVGMQIMTKPFPMEALGTKIRDMIAG
jgi:PAS domain S-box-containing protein